MTDDPKKLAAALESLESEKQRRIEQKIESGKAVRVHPIVVGAPESIDTERSRRLAEMSGETREIIFGNKADEGESIAAIITGVPRADRDPEVASAPASVSHTAERQPEGVAVRVHTVLGERKVTVGHSARPQPPSVPTGQHYRVRVTISPTSERDCGFQIDGTFTVSDQVRVYDTGGKLIGASPFKPGDDIEALARKLLREKSIGGSGFYGALNYPPRSFH
jgi:hypothetical protein